ncbi:LptF/LptG family permease [Candidatus Pelagibacter sp. HIMB1593]|uniref:LptF/LptG family permease n=1 Tax=Candidatus Pelagibacter sp. HIMB1593 TaxID=3413355 RepID=UPI003F865F10
MKKLLYRKLFKDYLLFFLIALFSSSLIIWVFQAVNFLDIMVEDGREYTVYINYSLLNFPKIISRLIPFVLFFSVFYVLLQYELKNELIIFWNFGEDKKKFVNFIIFVSTFLLLIQFLLTSFIVPNSQNKARSFLRDSSVNFFGSFIKPKRFNDTIDGVTIYTENKDKDGYLYNLYIKKDIDKGFEITYAKKGIFKQISNVPVLILYNGETIINNVNQITNFNFSKSDFLLKNLQSNTITTTKTQEMKTMDIISCVIAINNIKANLFKRKQDEIQNCTSPNRINITKELYKRLIVPLYIPTLMLVPYLLILSSKEKLNFKKLKLITFLAGFFTIIFSEGIVRFINKEFTENIVIFISPLISFLFLYLIFVYKLIYKNKIK